ncbi:MAG: ATP-dependent helicase [Candidatus Pacebacteria bacterium]|nr:ATP-dependent helicase [Candidatus Paceibacterota bacterium]
MELSYIYEEYEKALEQSHFYDYNDMILLVLKKMKTEKSFLLDLQEQYQYILVDEFQDTNMSQYDLLTTLASYDDTPNLFVVGDTKQAIYRFQGASNYNFINFKERFSTAVQVDLVNNYRSTQSILDSAFSLINQDKELKSNQEKGKKIQVIKNINQKLEAFFVAKKIQELNTDLNNIAVLYRSHKDSKELVDILQKLNIPFNIKDKNSIFNDIDIEKFIILLNTIANYGNDTYLAKAMHLDFLNLNELDIYKIINKFSTNKSIINLYDTDYTDLNLKDIDAVDTLFKNLKS